MSLFGWATRYAGDDGEMLDSQHVRNAALVQERV